MNPYKEAIKELQIVKTMETAVKALEIKEKEDPNYIHLNIEMLSGTIDVLLELKGHLQQQVNKISNK